MGARGGDGAPLPMPEFRVLRSQLQAPLAHGAALLVRVQAVRKVLLHVLHAPFPAAHPGLDAHPRLPSGLRALLPGRRHEREAQVPRLAEILNVVAKFVAFVEKYENARCAAS